MRRRRFVIAAVVMWSLAFAQAAMAAHACGMPTSALGSPAQGIEGASSMHAGCAGASSHSNPAPSACESHCYADQQVQGQADVPTASIAPQPALIARLAEAPVPAFFMASSLAQPAGAPPPQLLFVRFLI